MSDKLEVLIVDICDINKSITLNVKWWYQLENWLEDHDLCGVCIEKVVHWLDEDIDCERSEKQLTIKEVLERFKLGNDERVHVLWVNTIIDSLDFVEMLEVLSYLKEREE